MKFFVFVFACILVTAYAADDDKGCFVESLGKKIPVGEKVPVEGKCLGQFCTDELTLVDVPCILTHNDRCIEPFGTPYDIPADDSKPYPDCCPSNGCNRANKDN